MQYLIVNKSDVYSFEYAINDRIAKYVEGSLRVEDGSIIESHQDSIVATCVNCTHHDVSELEVTAVERLASDLLRLTVRNPNQDVEFTYDILGPETEANITRYLLTFCNNAAPERLRLPTITFKH